MVPGRWRPRPGFRIEPDSRFSQSTVTRASLCGWLTPRPFHPSKTCSEPEEVREVVTGQLHGSALFAARFRENAARSLLLPRARPGSRTPLWLQRQRSADLLAVAARYPDFPVLAETYRECLTEVFDIPALTELMRGVQIG